MEKKQTEFEKEWQKFIESGKMEDYLQYKQVEKKKQDGRYKKK
jgi:hypothetical protein